MARYNNIQLIKREFFAMRNGVIADSMRRAGMPYRIIFGLNLPQLQDIAKGVGENVDIALSLWDNRTTRESMLLAPMIMPGDYMTLELARKWISESPTAEVVDMLCHKLLRHCPFAMELALGLSMSESDMDRYASLRLLFNLLPASLEQAGKIAGAETKRDCRATKALATQLLDEVAFLSDGI